MNWDWLFGKKEEPEEDQHYCWTADPVVFEGTTAQLLASLPPAPEMTEPVVEPPVEEETKEDDNMEVEQAEKLELAYSADSVWTNIELLKMAIEIEASKKQKTIFYVDIGNLPKLKVEPYLKEAQKMAKDKDGDFWLPRREGGRGTEITTAPGRVTLDGVLETAQKLKEFVTAK